VGITLQGHLHLRRQTIEAAAHIGQPACQIDGKQFEATAPSRPLFTIHDRLSESFAVGRSSLRAAGHFRPAGRQPSCMRRSARRMAGISRLR